MSATIKELVLAQITTLLNGTITVGTTTIPYFVDYFGEQKQGIYMQTYTQDDESSKHYFAAIVGIELVVFGKGKTPDFVAEATRKVMQALKASVNATIQLTGDHKATYTVIPNVTSFTEYDNETTHRDTIRITLRVDEYKS
jgi:ribosomal protein L25 (general stress protein Ctc)